MIQLHSLMISKPNQSQWLLYKHRCNKFGKQETLYLPQIYGAAMPERLEMVLPVIKYKEILNLKVHLGSRL